MSEKLEINAESINAIFSAMGALAMCVTRHMSPEQREAIANDLARLAATSERDGDTMLETLLIDLQRAVR